MTLLYPCKDTYITHFFSFKCHVRFGQEPFLHFQNRAGVGVGSERAVLAIEYSKEERLTDFVRFDWLITSDPL